MTDSYKVRTSQLPNFHDENMKRNEEQENFFSPSRLILSPPPSLPISSYSSRVGKVLLKFYLIDRKPKIRSSQYTRHLSIEKSKAPF